MHATIHLHFEVTRNAEGYAITCGEKKLEQARTPRAAKRLVTAIECGALIAGAVVSSSMPAEVRRINL